MVSASSRFRPFQSSSKNLATMCLLSFMFDTRPHALFSVRLQAPVDKNGLYSRRGCRWHGTTGPWKMAKNDAHSDSPGRAALAVNQKIRSAVLGHRQRDSSAAKHGGMGKNVIPRLTKDLSAQFPDMKAFADAWSGRNNFAAACCKITVVPQLRPYRQGEGPCRKYNFDFLTRPDVAEILNLQSRGSWAKTVPG